MKEAATHDVEEKTLVFDSETGEQVIWRSARRRMALATRTRRAVAVAPGTFAAAATSVAPTLIEALVAERARLATIVAHLDGTIAALGGAS
jgi:hypothetical protein